MLASTSWCMHYIYIYVIIAQTQTIPKIMNMFQGNKFCSSNMHLSNTPVRPVYILLIQVNVIYHSHFIPGHSHPFNNA